MEDFDLGEYLEAKLPWVQLTPAGDQYHGPCPFHEEDPEKAGRFYVKADPEADPLALFHCLGGDTGVITKQGVFKISELVGTEPELLVNNGNGSSIWRNAPIESFGEQKLYELKLSRNGIKKTIFATEGHRWFKYRKGNPKKELITTELKAGDRLISSIKKAKHEKRRWQVVSVKETDRVEEVFCAVVEGIGNFTLEGNILTGNCFRCGESGALNKLRKHFGDSTFKSGNKIGSVKQDDMTLKLLSEATDYCFGTLFKDSGEKALSYLTGPKRGLTIDTIEQFKFGYDDGSLMGHLLSLLGKGGYEDEEARQMINDAGLSTKSGRGFLDGKISIPYFDMGVPISLRAKDMDGKYFSPTGSGKYLFNHDALIDPVNDGIGIIICEGEFDAAMACQLGFVAVGVPGATVWDDSWTREIQGRKGRAYVLYDADDAGQKAAAKLMENLGAVARHMEIPVVAPGGGSVDVTDWVQTYGATRESMEALIDSCRGGILISPLQAYEDWKIQQNKRLDGKKLILGYKPFDDAFEYGIEPGQLVITVARTGSGKSQPVTTLTPTPNGFRPIGDLEITDEVFARDGSPTKVVAIHPQGVLDTYRVHFSDGTWADCNEEHLWDVEFIYGHSHTWVRETMTLKQIMEFDLKKRRAWRFRIPMCEPVQYPKADLPITPYTLGALLADGYLAGTSTILTTNNQEVVDRVSLSHKVNEQTVDTDKYTRRFCLPGMVDSMRELGLFGHKSGTKFIPEQYLLASVPQRMALLQGLMDCDGRSHAKRGRNISSYSSTSERLIEGVAELVNSLGGTCKISLTKHPKGDYWTSSIMLPEEILPFSVSGKMGSADSPYKTVTHRAIVQIEELEQPVDQVCIEVDNPEHLYLTGRNYIVTHNSITAFNMLQRMRIADPDVKLLLFSLEQTRTEWFDRAWKIDRFYSSEVNPITAQQSTASSWNDNLMMSDKNAIDHDEFMRAIEDYEMAMGDIPRLVVVDYLGYWARSSAGSSEYERMTNAVMDLKAVAKGLGISIYAPHQANRGNQLGKTVNLDDARGAGTIEETADVLFSLARPDQGMDEEGNPKEISNELEMRVMKSRNGGLGVTADLFQAPYSLAVVERAEKHWYDLAKAERSSLANRDNYEQAFQRRLNNDYGLEF